MMGWPLFPVGLGLVDGDWRVSPVLPSGSVNWGGSFAVVPYISHNIDCAIALADWLTSDGTAQEMWPAQGSFPAQTAVLAEGVTTTEDQSTFFGGQDVAQVFTDMAKSIHSPTYRGRNYPWIQDDVILGSMAAVQQGSQTTEQAWDQAVSMFDAKDFTATD
jgi:ABC-type glycerol-3-phosphate transport system substrate-binding protein